MIAIENSICLRASTARVSQHSTCLYFALYIGVAIMLAIGRLTNQDVSPPHRKLAISVAILERLADSPTYGCFLRFFVQALEEAAGTIKTDAPWYKLVGLSYDPMASQAAEVTVNGVMDSSIVDGLLDVANKTALAPVLSVVKDLVEAVRACAKARRELLELIEFCVGILRCVVTVGGRRSLPEHIRQTLSHLQTEIEEIYRFVLQFKTPTCICWDLARKSRDRSTIAAHRKKLRRYLDTLAKSLAVAAVVPPRPRRTRRGARIPHGVPELPRSYVKRSVDDSAVEDLVHPHGGSSCARCFCLWGMGGGGKSLLASSVVRNKRTLACFERGIFWMQVGTSGREQKAMLLEQLALKFSRIPSPNGSSCPEVFDDTEDIIQYLQDARGDSRCLAVLDDVWHEDVVEAFLRTGFDLLITTRTRSVVPSCASTSFTEVGSMAEKEALQLLAKTSQAAGPLPEVETTLVRSAETDGYHTFFFSFCISSIREMNR